MEEGQRETEKPACAWHNVREKQYEKTKSHRIFPQLGVQIPAKD
jgi:hypothetical protein